MNFRETLEKAKELEISAIDLIVADEVNAIFDEEDERFEEMCSLVKTAYLKSENIEVWQLVKALEYKLEKGYKIRAIDKWDLILQASNY